MVGEEGGVKKRRGQKDPTQQLNRERGSSILGRRFPRKDPGQRGKVTKKKGYVCRGEEEGRDFGMKKKKHEIKKQLGLTERKKG